MFFTSRFLATLLSLFVLAATAKAELLIYTPMDNDTVGAGLGNDTTAVSAFDVFDVAGSAQNGRATDVLNLPDGTTDPAFVASGAPGAAGQALTFSDATNLNRGVDFGDVASPGTGSYTVSLWFNASDVSGTEFLASKGNRGSNNEGWSMFIQNDAVFLRADPVGTDSSQNLGVGHTFTANEWHHVALVIDNAAGTFTGYYDGLSSGGDGAENGFALGGGGDTVLFTPGSDFSAGSPLRIAVNDAGTSEFKGMLDEFAIWNEALTPTEVGNVFQRGVAGLSVPEPSTYALVCGLLALAAVRLRRRR